MPDSPVRALAARLLDLLPGADLPRAVELLEEYAAEVREQALREAIVALRDFPYARSILLALPEKRTHG